MCYYQTQVVWTRVCSFTGSCCHKKQNWKWFISVASQNWNFKKLVGLWWPSHLNFFGDLSLVSVKAGPLIRTHTHTRTVSLLHSKCRSLGVQPSINLNTLTNSGINSPPISRIFVHRHPPLPLPTTTTKPSQALWRDGGKTEKEQERGLQRSSGRGCLLWSYFEAHFTQHDQAGPLVLGCCVYCAG